MDHLIAPSSGSRSPDLNPLSSEKGDAHSSWMRAAAAAIHHLSVQSRDLRRDAQQRARRADSGPSHPRPGTGGSTPIREKSAVPDPTAALLSGMCMTQWQTRTHRFRPGSNRISKRGGCRATASGRPRVQDTQKFNQIVTALPRSTSLLAVLTAPTRGRDEPAERGSLKWARLAMP
jgi:hypothetical protein